MSVDEIIKILDEFVLFPKDDPESDKESYLSNLMDEWKKAEAKNKAIPTIFHLMEWFSHDAFGSPSTLVQALEADGSTGYEVELQHSLLRKPTPLTLWIYNWLINAEKERKLIGDHIIESKVPSCNIGLG